MHFRILYSFFSCSICVFSFLIGIFSYFFFTTTIDLSRLECLISTQPTIVLDDTGNELFRFQIDRRDDINLSSIPNHVIQAFLSAEDHNFFSHSGLSWRGILRSILVNLYHRKLKQGASTITQQLIKLLYFDTKRVFSRKIKEQWYAILAERQYSKQQILQAYLNNVYFGCGIYGVEAACQRFWSKSLIDITLDEAATLAGIVQSPGRFCPLLHPDLSQKRRNIVLHSMYSCGLIDQNSYRQSLDKDLSLVPERDGHMAPHAKETIRLFIEELIDKKNLYQGGYIVQTTLNKDIQKNAEDSFSCQVRYLKKHLHNQIDGALMCMDVHSGEVKAMIGGINFKTSQFNRALHAKRQFGSIFKPLVYTAAIECGSNFLDTEIDEPYLIDQGVEKWEPRNYNRQYEGPMTLARALSHSNNIISVKILEKIGPEKVVDVAKRCMIKQTLKPFLSLALGCIDATLYEALGMFNVFANGGMYVEPHYIRWVKDEWGKKIYMVHPLKKRAIERIISDQVAKILSLGMESMKKNQPDKWINSEGLGKTGTTNASRTCWFAGATPSHTTVIYLGCDDNQSLGNNVLGSMIAFPIWFGLHKKLLSQQSNFCFDPNLKEIAIDSYSGKPCIAQNHSDVYSILINSSTASAGFVA